MFLRKKCSDFHLLEIHNSKSIQDKQKKIAGKKKKSRFSPFLLFQFTITLVTTTKIFLFNSTLSSAKESDNNGNTTLILFFSCDKSNIYYSLQIIIFYVLQHK